ncbi:hypothetical protein YPD27_3207 [Yersinia pestis KIM D27]|nr:hypothetical protein YPD27_3207 [Yersinia pestis KIM D27]
MAEPKPASWMPSHAAAQLCRQLQSLLPMHLLAPAAFEQILRYCGVRPGRQAWRLFLSRTLLLAGSLAAICGVIFSLRGTGQQCPQWQSSVSSNC